MTTVAPGDYLLRRGPRVFSLSWPPAASLAPGATSLSGVLRGQVELALLDAGEEGLPLVPGVHVRCLAPVLGVAYRDAPLGKVSDLDAAATAACAALEPAQTPEVIHLTLLTLIISFCV